MNLANVFNKIKAVLRNNSCTNLIWLINFLPRLAGFPLQTTKNNVYFWGIHIALLVYVYILGTVVYQIYFADGFIDSINSFFNISILIIILNNTCWLLLNRKRLNNLLLLVQKNDELVKESGKHLENYNKMTRNIKIIIIVCYIFHFVNDILIFIPTRTLDMDEFSVSSCVGMEPLTKTPNREICMIVLAVQELTGIVAVGSYDVILLFLFSHTTAIFQALYEDMSDITNTTDTQEDLKASKKIENIITRHTLALETVKELQNIYSVAIGIGFGLNAISMCLFFVLPLDVCLNFGPLIYYIIFVFFLYCVQGQRLTTASERFEMAVYCCGWEGMDVKEQKSVLLMLKQAQKPVLLLAAGIIPIRIHTFANTMQSIYKFVTIFKV